MERAAGPDVTEECGADGLGFAIQPANVLAEGAAVG